MASQQPTRPWFRLPSVARPAPSPSNGSLPPPPLAAAPEPPPPQLRQPLMRPAFRPVTLPQPQPQPQLEPPTTAMPPPVSSPPPPPPPPPPPQTITASPPSPPPPANTRAPEPASPPKQAAPYPTSSLPSSPQKPIVPQTSPPIRDRDTAYKGTATSASMAATATSPPQPPSVVRTPSPQPPITTYTPHAPPSPLILPPPQAIPDSRIPPEAEQKTILVQKTVADADARKLQHENHHHHHHHHRAKKVVHPSDSEEGGMRVITLAGENKGAFMELVRPKPRPTGFTHYLFKRGNSSSSSGGEDRSIDDKRSGFPAAAEPHPMRAFANSNVQGLNNSIVYNSSCNHHDPGVHLSLSRKLAGGPPPPHLGLRQRPKEGPAGDHTSGSGYMS